MTAARKTAKRPLWKCPKCGHKFVTRNLWHSCVNVPIAAHFRGARAPLRKTFSAWLAAARACGRVTVYAQKSRITIMARVRFAGAVVHNSYLDAGLWLRRKATHPALRKIEDYGRLGCVHHFRLTSPDDVDARLRELMAEAYRVGTQEITAKSVGH